MKKPNKCYTCYGTCYCDCTYECATSYLCWRVVTLLCNLYNDGNSSFSSDEFWAFKGLLDCSLHIHMKWVANLNDSSEQLAFIVNGDKLWAMHNELVLKVRTILIQDSFQSLISQWLECSNNLLTLFSFLFILVCFEFGVLYSFKCYTFQFGALFSFNMCCNFLFLISFCWFVGVATLLVFNVCCYLQLFFFQSFCWFVATTTQLVKELDNHFPQCALLDAMGIVYPQYQLQPNYDNSFTKNLEVLQA